MKKIKPLVFLADDDPIYTSLYESFLHMYDLAKVKIFLTVESLLKNIHFNPDIVMLDFSLNNNNGIEVHKQINAISPTSKVVFLTSNDNHFQIGYLANNKEKHSFLKKDQEAFSALRKIICNIRLSKI